MLSRHAERIYWMTRYMERVEATSVLLHAFSQSMLDIPAGMELGWDLLLKITSSEEEFKKRYDVVNEHNVVHFMLADPENPDSLLVSVRNARENARTVRDQIASDCWEILNELHLEVKKSAESSVGRRNRHAFLRDIRAYCQRYTGLLESTFTRDQTHAFLKMGRYVERADMTTRILDVSAGFLLNRRKSPMRFDTLLWMHMLNSLNALVMYRRKIGPRISYKGVMNFLMHDDQFPRSLTFCFHRMENCLTGLPRAEGVQDILSKAQLTIERFDTVDVDSDGLHLLMDDIQLNLIQVHAAINETWFTLGEPEALTSQQSQS